MLIFPHKVDNELARVAAGLFTGWSRCQRLDLQCSGENIDYINHLAGIMIGTVCGLALLLACRFTQRQAPPDATT